MYNFLLDRFIVSIPIFVANIAFMPWMTHCIAGNDDDDDMWYFIWAVAWPTSPFCRLRVRILTYEPYSGWEMTQKWKNSVAVWFADVKCEISLVVHLQTPIARVIWQKEYLGISIPWWSLIDVVAFTYGCWPKEMSSLSDWASIDTCMMPLVLTRYLS